MHGIASFYTDRTVARRRRQAWCLCKRDAVRLEPIAWWGHL